MDKIEEELLTRGVATIIPSKEKLAQALRTGKKLNIYFGIDPTATRIHIGHAVPLRKLQIFAKLGHNVTFLIGDFTALIGDTSDKDSERPVLTSKQIEENFKSYREQAEKVLDFSKINIKHNGTWLNKLTLAEIVKLTQHFSLGDFISRELIRKRLSEGKKVGLHEVLYPAMQGYDSYHLDTDIQIGGSDQIFNMQAGRTLQKDLRNKESFVITNEFVMGTDGRKMSKSWGNAIWLDDNPDDMYGKIMSIKDELIIQYFTLATNKTLSEIFVIENKLKSGENPMNLKKLLASTIVSELHSEKEAEKSQNQFENLFQKREIGEALIPTLNAKSGEEMSLVKILIKAGISTSKSQAKRLIEQGGVEIDSVVCRDMNYILKTSKNVILKVGKKKFLKIKAE